MQTAFALTRVKQDEHDTRLAMIRQADVTQLNQMTIADKPRLGFERLRGHNTRRHH